MTKKTKKKPDTNVVPFTFPDLPDEDENERQLSHDEIAEMLVESTMRFSTAASAAPRRRSGASHSNAWGLGQTRPRSTSVEDFICKVRADGAGYLLKL